MKIVIDIPEDVYNRCKEYRLQCGEAEVLESAVARGTPLPKGHGRLIDADELYGDFIDGTEGYDCNTWNRIEIGDIIEDAPTIIEADKSESKLDGEAVDADKAVKHYEGTLEVLKGIDLEVDG